MAPSGRYLAMPVLEAGEWAAAQSAGQPAELVLDQVRQSVRDQSKRGHEYALHLHSDYDPEVPGNVLSYHPPVGGLWANHLRRLGPIRFRTRAYPPAGAGPAFCFIICGKSAN